MKPNFALTLSDNGARLLHRADGGWTRVGRVPFDDADLPAALKALRHRAARIAGDRPGSLACKIVIPNDQIKYMSIEAEGDPDTAVRAALDGATPYAVEDLEYDWTAAEGVIQIAAVALETLAEAEAFATEHGFDAVSFAAIPDGPEFRGEPFFGVTRRAAEILPNGTMVERDNAAIRITGDAQIPEPGAKPQAPDRTPDAPVASAAAEAVATVPPASKAAGTKEGAPESGAPKPGARTSVAAPQPEGPPAPKPQAAPPAAAPKDAAPPAPKGAPVAAFTSIRASRGDDPARATPPLSGGARARSSEATGKTPGASAAPPLPSPASDDVTDPARLAELAASLHPDPTERLDRDAALSARAEDAAADTAAEDAGRSARKSRSGAPTREDEKQRMTVFGARQGPVRGKPRFLGLILTAILLLFLVGVAAWASIFLEDGLSRFFGPGDEIKLADVPAADEDTAAETAPDRTAAITPLPGTAQPEDGRERPEVTALPELPEPLAPSEALAQYAATGIWQMAPVSPEIPSAGAPLSDIYEVSLDPGIGLGDPASMPRRAPDARDVRPETPVDPPPAGTRFDFDDRGFVRATPGGVLTPQGVRVFAGSPPMTPPETMAQSVTVTATPATAEPELAAGTSFTGDPSLAGTRPRLRPESIMAVSGAEPEGAPETREDGLNTATGTDDDTRLASADPALAALRPQLRPAKMEAALAATLQTVQEAAAVPLVDNAALTRALTAATAAEAAADDPEAAADEQDSFNGATAQAVSASLTPLRRPKGFKETVERNRTTRAVVAQPAAAAVQKVQPGIPSSASVSQQATIQDAINLRKVNLIGVYGSTSSRRALVRLGNGRYQKVRVGDALDGGQVAAIGDSELRYIKSGQNVVLRIPQG